MALFRCGNESTKNVVLKSTASSGSGSWTLSVADGDYIACYIVSPNAPTPSLSGITYETIQNPTQDPDTSTSYVALYKATSTGTLSFVGTSGYGSGCITYILQ